jgi:hypothetical protein
MIKEIYDTIRNLPPEIIINGCLGTACLSVGGMIAYITVGICKSAKEVGEQFNRLKNNYRDNFSKEELITFYKDLKIEVSPNILSEKKIKIIHEIENGLEKQIMKYATEEVKIALDRGEILNFENPIENISQTYQKAKKINQELEAEDNR